MNLKISTLRNLYIERNDLHIVAMNSSVFTVSERSVKSRDEIMPPKALWVIVRRSFKSCRDTQLNMYPWGLISTVYGQENGWG